MLVMVINVGLALIITGLGAVFGSFAGATTWRIHQQKDIVKDRSECEHCHHKLAAWDLIPIISWLALAGRCRYCRRPIGVGTLIFEIGLALAFGLSYVFWPGSLSTSWGLASLVLWLISLVLLAILFAYDLKWFMLPDVVMAPLIACGLGLFIIHAATADWSLQQVVVQFLAGLLPVTGLYGVLLVVSQGRWIGDSDVILGVFMGLVLGWQGALLAVFLANFIGLVAIMPKLIGNRLAAKDQVPFGPYLILACFITYLFGQGIISWYFSLILA